MINEDQQRQHEYTITIDNITTQSLPKYERSK